MIALQLYVLGQQVEMFDDEAVNLSQSIQDVKDIDKIFTEFTQTFSVPASKINNIIFRHFYNSDIVENLEFPELGSYDGRKKIDAELYLNYKPFKVGKIKLEGSTLKLNKPHTYRLTFFGDTVNLKDQLGDAKLSSLEFLSGFKYAYSEFNVIKSFETGLDVTHKGVLYEKAIITPLITTKQRLIYNSSAATATTDALANLYADQNSGSNLGGVNSSQLKPALSVYVIVKAIEEQYFKRDGFTFSGDFFSKNNASYYNLYLWLHNKEGQLFEDQINTIPFDDYTYTESSYRFRTLSSVEGGAFQTKPPNYDPRGKLSMEAPLSAKYTVLVYKDGELWQSYDGNGSQTFEVGSFPDHKTIHAELKTTAIGDFKITWELSRTREIFLSANETMTANLSQEVSTTSGKILQTVRQVPDMTIIDFLQGLFKMFNLTSYITKDKEVKIQALDNYYANSDVYWDITKDLDKESSTVDTVLPYREINFTYEGLGSFLAENHKEQFNKDWGSVRYSDNDKLSGSVYNVKIPFEHFKYERLIDVNNGNQTDIQVGWSVDSGQSSYLGKPLLFYPQKVTGTRIGYIRLDSAYESRTTYFIPSNSVHLFSESNGVDTSDNLNFNAEQNEYIGTPFNKTLFEKYYKTYIKEIFDKRKRLTKVKAYLPVSTLHSLSLADKIVIFNKAYRINKLQTNFETLLSSLELINITEDAAIIVPAKFLPAENCNVNADTTFTTADNSSFTADKQCNAEGLEVISFIEEIPKDTAPSNKIINPTPTKPLFVDRPWLEFLAPTASTTTQVSLAIKVIRLGILGEANQIDEFGFFYSEDINDLTVSSANSIDTINALRAKSSVTNIKFETDTDSKYRLPGEVRFTVKGLTAPKSIYSRAYAITSNNENYNSGAVIVSVKTASTSITPSYVGVEGFILRYDLPISSNKRTIRVRNRDNTFTDFANITGATIYSTIVPFVVEGAAYSFTPFDSSGHTQYSHSGMDLDGISNFYYGSTGYDTNDRSTAEGYARNLGGTRGEIGRGVYQFSNRSSQSDVIVPLKEGFNLFKNPRLHTDLTPHPNDGYYAFYNYNLDGTASFNSGISALVENGVCSSVQIFY